MPITRDEIYRALAQVMDPELNHDVVKLGIVRDVEVEDDGTVSLCVQLTSPHCPFADQIVESIRSAAQAVPGVTEVDIDWQCAGDA